MFSKRINSIIAITIVSVINILLFQNCGVQQPKIEDMSSLSMSGVMHSPIPLSCTACHSNARPTVAKTLAADGKSNLFVHTLQYGGQGDCVLCHTQTQADVGHTWRSGVFNHKSNMNVTVTTCNECHTGNMPVGPVGTTAFNHNTIGSQDCAQCHKNVGANWSTATYSHSPAPTSCNSCHNSARPNPTAYYAPDAAFPTSNLYVHASQYNGSADCVSCHTAVPANLGVTWAGGNYNHTTNTGATVATCINCHTGNRPTSHTSASGQLGDCVSCHTKAGVDWSSTGGAIPATVTLLAPTGTGLGSLVVKHPSVQSGMSCTTCHTNYNATNSIKGFDHTEGLTLASNSTKASNTCYYCHFSPSQVIDTTALTNNTSRTFVNGKIVIRANSHHGETLTNSSSCLDCHTSSSAPAWSTGTKTWTTGGSWNGG